jgi:Mg-chelatase subunit ChlD
VTFDGISAIKFQPSSQDLSFGQTSELKFQLVITVVDAAGSITKNLDLTVVKSSVKLLYFEATVKK